MTVSGGGEEGIEQIRRQTLKDAYDTLTALREKIMQAICHAGPLSEADKASLIEQGIVPALSPAEGFAGLPDHHQPHATSEHPGAGPDLMALAHTHSEPPSAAGGGEEALALVPELVDIIDRMIAGASECSACAGFARAWNENPESPLVRARSLKAGG